MDKVNMRKNKNRRGAFRIYEEVNLSYEKIDEKWIADHPLSLDNALNDHSFSTNIERLAQNPELSLPGPENNLPGAQFNEHESRNVNISASGMAFNCEDTLKEGDFLVIKIMLASSMSAIVTYSQVVYCKDLQSDGSPNDSPHPCFIGTHFVTMKEEDRERLTQHIDNKRKRQKWINGAIGATVITVIAFPDVVFSLLLGLTHFLFELFLHILHLSFEFIEMNLDHLIEHLFHTDLHQTQVIVFYIIMAFVVLGLYVLGRAVPSFCRRCKQAMSMAFAFKKANWLFFWREQSLFNKIKIAAIGITVVVCYIFFGM